MMMQSFDETTCSLGEGPLWHPKRSALFWFDILNKTLYCRSPEDTHAKVWIFEEMVSAAAWIDHDHLLIASETGLFTFNLNSRQCVPLQDLEADNPITRSNDGRADPFGGFWIGTMGKKAESGAGSIYRYYRGELRQVAKDITISNAICFSPDKSTAYYCDTAVGHLWQHRLDPYTGWPIGTAEILIDFSSEGLNPDGAVCDAAGNLWIAQWGASRVACYSPQGLFIEAIAVPTQQVSCPAFGGEKLSTLFATSAAVGLDNAVRSSEPAGHTFFSEMAVTGQQEYPFIPA